MRSDKGKNERIRVKSKFSANGHERWRIGNFYFTLVGRDDMTCSAPELR